jgi:hypothetical protein
MSWLDSAHWLGHHPTELALVLSVLVSLSWTTAIIATERARPWLRAGLERHGKLMGTRAVTVLRHLDGALVLLAVALLGVFGCSSTWSRRCWSRPGSRSGMPPS